MKKKEENNNEAIKYKNKWIMCKKICKLMMLDDDSIKNICKNYQDKFVQMEKDNKETLQ